MEMSKYELINIKRLINGEKGQVSKCGRFPILG